LVATSSVPELCHAVEVEFIVPLTGSPAECTDTLLSLPRPTVTLMPAAGLTFALSGAGLMASCAVFVGVGLGLAEWVAPCDELLVGVEPPAEHPAASSPAAALHTAAR
jgi:hypothetical protein